ncbi:MAG: hypothetical protein IIC46_11885 [Planctomycetes bacterium]|nr:hypothetical protein [Planctomycetota bacterium]
MRRRLTKLVVFLLLGAVVNVAVAWGCALCLPLMPAESSLSRFAVTHDEAPFWFVEERQRRGALRYLFSGVPFVFKNPPGTLLILPEEKPEEIEQFDLGDVPRWSRFDLTTAPHTYFQEDKYFESFEDARGWPLVALCASGKFHNPEVVLYVDSLIVTSGIVIDDRPPTPMNYDDWFDRRVLPLRPIWPGFALNTIFYAVIVWMMWSSTFAARRFMARRRGHCIKCGYGLRGEMSAGCPECGWRREDVP